MITKELFIETIEALRLQTIYDKQYAESMSVAFSTDVPAYKNDLLKVALVKMLQLYFPPVDGHCEIEHYCWVLDFGKPVDEDADVITAEDLWHELNKDK